MYTDQIIDKKRVKGVFFECGFNTVEMDSAKMEMAAFAVLAESRRFPVNPKPRASGVSIHAAGKSCLSAVQIRSGV